MKKLFLIFAILYLAVPCWAIDWGGNVWEPSQQFDKAIEGRALLEAVTQQLEQNVPQLQEIINSGKFDTLPAGEKDALLRWFNILKDARNAIGTDAEIMEIYNFRP